METFEIYRKPATGKPVITIADLIPKGRKNAINHKILATLCVKHGLIENAMNGKDEAVRLLIEKDRIDHVILKRCDNESYYRLSKDDMQDLQRCIRQQERKEEVSFKNPEMAKALYEDYKYAMKEVE